MTNAELRNSIHNRRRLWQNPRMDEYLTTGIIAAALFAVIAGIMASETGKNKSVDKATNNKPGNEDRSR